VVGLLRSVFDMRLVNATPSEHIITVRAPRATVDAAAEFLNQLSTAGPPPVMLEVQVFEIDRMVLRNLGIQPPSSYSMFSLAGVAALLSNSNVQQLINQLIASGGINQANNTALQALLAQLQQQQLNPLLTTPFATFGGGTTLMAVTLPPVTAKFQFNNSTVRTLQSLTLRALQGKAATLKIGSRYPILNATFSPIANSPAIASNIQANTFQAAFPSISYEDIGLTMKATPAVHGESDVTLDLETDIRALTGQAFNGVPVISNRGYKSTITVKDGEPAVVAGYLNRTEQLSLSGVPGLGNIPDLGLVAAGQNKTLEDDEFLLVVTPHILQAPASESQALWLPASK
jgi:type II secretory pathway component GspD/PulD (secretin)